MYLSVPRRFADLFNAGCFGGAEMMSAEMLEEAAERSRSSDGADQFRDIKKRLKNGTKLIIAAIENQENVDFEMPCRIMQYDSAEYAEQIRQIHREKERHRREKGLKRSRYAEKMKKPDRLFPVYTVCFYHGSKPWDGPKSLRDMMDFNESTIEGHNDAWSSLFQDYGMIFISALDKQIAERCTTELKYLLQALAVRNDKNELTSLLMSEAFQNLDHDTAELIAIMTDLPKYAQQLQQYRNETGGYMMCKATREIKEDGRRQGRRQGRDSALLASIHNLRRTMGLSVEEAMDALCIPDRDRTRYLKRI